MLTHHRQRTAFALLTTSVLALAACSKGDTAADTTAMRDSAGMATPNNGMAAGATTAQAANGEMQAVLDKLASMNPLPLETLTPAEARKQPTPADAANAVAATKDTTSLPVRSADRTIPGAAGPIPARVYTPTTGSGPFPVVVYYHGGGWVIADKNVYDGGARGLSAAAGAVVVSIDYRLAPEHKFPAAHDDAFAAYKWAVANAASINGDPKRVALAGESAGGNLAVATAIAARDGNVQKPVAVISVYPVAQSDTTTASYTTYAAAKPLSRPMMGWFLKHTLSDPSQAKDPRLSLVTANLAGLPPVTIINAEIDPLRDDGAMLEEALKKANVEVERRHYDGVTHEFFGMAKVVNEAKEAQAYAGSRLKSAFGM